MTKKTFSSSLLSDKINKLNIYINPNKQDVIEKEGENQKFKDLLQKRKKAEEQFNQETALANCLHDPVYQMLEKT
ncbi:MAG: hypothetical protein LBD75_08380 [Candidatus Peribacteria bacterium]|jgi:hypothetical protein|nr:hypothetical protein [Candidatus Peribacteria bacterium]